jgi:hypothetical protein
MSQRSDGCFILWPEKRFVPKNIIRQWYEDAVANGEVDPLTPPLNDDMHAQAKVLASEGIITLRK